VKKKEKKKWVGGCGGKSVGQVVEVDLDGFIIVIIITTTTITISVIIICYYRLFGHQALVRKIINDLLLLRKKYISYYLFQKIFDNYMLL